MMNLFVAAATVVCVAAQGVQQQSVLASFEMPNGLSWNVLVAGSGPTPGPTDSVVVHYKGWFDGTQTIFDDSRKGGKTTPATFKVNNLIKGVSQALEYFQKGGTYQLFVPAALAYGAAGIPGVIPPNSDLNFLYEMIDIIKEQGVLGQPPYKGTDGQYYCASNLEASCTGPPPAGKTLADVCLCMGGPGSVGREPKSENGNYFCDAGLVAKCDAALAEKLLATMMYYSCNCISPAEQATYKVKAPPTKALKPTAPMLDPNKPGYLNTPPYVENGQYYCQTPLDAVCQTQTPAGCTLYYCQYPGTAPKPTAPPATITIPGTSTTVVASTACRVCVSALDSWCLDNWDAKCASTSMAYCAPQCGSAAPAATPTSAPINAASTPKPAVGALPTQACRLCVGGTDPFCISEWDTTCASQAVNGPCKNTCSGTGTGPASNPQPTAPGPAVPPGTPLLNNPSSQCRQCVGGYDSTCLMGWPVNCQVIGAQSSGPCSSACGITTLAPPQPTQKPVAPAPSTPKPTTPPPPTTPQQVAYLNNPSPECFYCMVNVSPLCTSWPVQCQAAAADKTGPCAIPCGVASAPALPAPAAPTQPTDPAASGMIPLLNNPSADCFYCMVGVSPLCAMGWPTVCQAAAAEKGGPCQVPCGVAAAAPTTPVGSDNQVGTSTTGTPLLNNPSPQCKACVGAGDAFCLGNWDIMCQSEGGKPNGKCAVPCGVASGVVAAGGVSPSTPKPTVPALPAPGSPGEPSPACRSCVGQKDSYCVFGWDTICQNVSGGACAAQCSVGAAALPQPSTTCQGCVNAVDAFCGVGKVSAWDSFCLTHMTSKCAVACTPCNSCVATASAKCPAADHKNWLDNGCKTTMQSSQCASKCN